MVVPFIHFSEPPCHERPSRGERCAACRVRLQRRGRLVLVAGEDRLICQTCESLLPWRWGPRLLCLAILEVA